MPVAFTVLAYLASSVTILFVITSVAATLPIDTIWRDVGRTIAAEVRPFYLPAVTVSYAYDFQSHFVHGTAIQRLFYAVGLAGGLAFYWMYNDDDDRWRKRRKKLTEKITRAGSRLVVSPQGTA